MTTPMTPAEARKAEVERWYARRAAEKAEWENRPLCNRCGVVQVVDLTWPQCRACLALSAAERDAKRSL